MEARIASIRKRHTIGILTQVIGAELDKKKQQRLDEINIYKYVLGLPNDQLEPGLKDRTFEKMLKLAPKGVQELLQTAKPMLMKGPPSQTDGGSQVSDKAEGGEAKSGQQPGFTGQRGKYFKSQEELDFEEDQREKQKSARDIEKATKEYTIKKNVDRATTTLNRAQDAEDLKALDKRTDLTEDEKQRLAANIGVRGTSEGAWTSGAMILPNGQRIYGSINKNNPNVIKIPNGQPGGQDIAAPPLARIVTIEELDRENKPPTEAQQKDAEIFGAYAEKHNLDKDKLTDTQKQEAREESKDKQPTASAQTRKDAIDAYKEKHKLNRDLTAVEIQSAIAEQKLAEESPDAKAQRALTLELARERLLKEREERSTTPKDIQPGSREYRVAQDLAYGRLTIQDFRSLTAYSRNTNLKLDIYDKAAQLNPNFNPAQFEMGFKLAANPKVQQQLASLDNVKMGVDDLLRASDAATRTGSPLLNKAVIPGGIALGNKKYSNFATARTAFADELSGALGYGSATDMSREMGFSMTNANLSPEQFRSGIQDIVIPFVDRKKKSLLDQMGVYGQPGMNPAASGHVIEVNGKRYQYKGYGATDDLSNYSEVKK